jgi:hypothetical protein
MLPRVYACFCLFLHVAACFIMLQQKRFCQNQLRYFGLRPALEWHEMLLEKADECKPNHNPTFLMEEILIKGLGILWADHSGRAV